VKGAARERINAEVDILIYRYRTDVSFGDVGVDLHFREIIRDRKNHRRLQTGRDRLSDVDAAGDHLAVHRRCNRAMIEIGLRFIERALFNFHIRFGLMQVRRRLIDVSLRRIFFREQFLDPRRIHFGQF
jgi:hypothetical protein